jgi:uncharacterized protein YndB with AHSA1/START domain
MTDPVVKIIEVPCDPETAFKIFTDRMTEWWPLGRNSVSAMGGGIAKSVSLEGRVGGAITEIGPSGEVHNWGSVRRWEPGEALSLAWHIGKPAREATIVDVAFEANGQGGARVTLTHHGWEALGDEADKMREGYNQGWVGVFEDAYSGACAA